MDLTKEIKEQIDNLTYTELLQRWRFSPSGDKWFQGETGVYWAERMKELRDRGASHARASKKIGWDNRKEYKDGI